MDYRAALSKCFPGEAPDYLSLEGYIDAKILLEGVKRAGATVTTEAIIAALESIHDADIGLGVPIGFSTSEHQASHRIWGTELDGAGHFRAIDLQ